MSKKLLFKNSDPVKYWTVYRHLINQIHDTAVKNDLQYVHYYGVAHYYGIKSKHDSSLLYLDSIYADNKNDLLIQELITANLLEIMQGIASERTAMDSFDSVFKRYPFIDKQSKLGEFYAYCVARTASSAFEKENKKEGDKYLSVIYNLIETELVLKKKSEPYFIAAFLEAYFYYMGERQYKEAKEFLISVLKYYPENEELQKRMKFVTKMLE